MALVVVLFSFQAFAQSTYPYENYNGIEDPVKAKEAFYEDQVNQELPYYNFNGIKDKVEAKEQWYKANKKKFSSQTNGGKGNVNAPEIVGNDFCGDAILKIEQVFERPVKAICPDIDTAAGIDQTGRYSYPVTDFSHTALDDIVDPQLLFYITDIDIDILIDKHRVSRNDRQPRDL